MCPNCSHDNRDSAHFCARCQAELQGLLGANTVLNKGRYRVLRVLGCGGMGAVYLAEDTVLGDKKVAVKENFDTSPAARAQFQREAVILAHLTHPNLPRVSDHFIEASGRQYLVMDWVEGRSLLDVLEATGGQPLAEGQVLDWAGQLLDALAYCHSRGAIHRDVKPQNVILTPLGKAIMVDFGLVKLYDPTRPSTSLGLRGLGTLEYAPPEQYGTGTAHTEARSDLYALGATLYHLLTAQTPPISGQRTANPAMLRPPRQLNPRISPGVEAVILKAMELSIAKRFQSADDMRQALCDGPVTPPSPPVGQRRIPVVWPIAGAVVLVLLGGLAWALLTGVLPPPPATPTPTVTILIAVAPPTATATYTRTPARPSSTPIPATVPPTSPPLTPSDTLSPAVSTSTPDVLADTPAPPAAPTDTPVPLPPAPPGGGRIAFTSSRDSGNSEVYVMNVDGSGQTNLTNNWHDTDWFDCCPSWSPDGTRIAYTGDNNEIYTINADGSQQTNLTKRGWQDYEPAWSPNGRQIAFMSRRDGNLEIYVMNADGSGQTNLTNHAADDCDAVWSPDNSRIAFWSKRDGRNEVYVMNADGSAVVRLTNVPGDNDTPAWSPDGTRIAFESKRDGNWEIYVMNADGSGQTNLTNNPADDHHAAWSPDGKRIAFMSYRDGNAEIYVMNADGSGQTNLTNNPGFDGFPAWAPNPTSQAAQAPAAAPKPTAVPPVSSEPSGALVYAAPTNLVVKPASGNNISFSWRWNGSLQETEFFELRIWSGDGPHWGGVEPTKDHSAVVDMFILARAEYDPSRTSWEEHKWRDPLRPDLVNATRFCAAVAVITKEPYTSLSPESNTFCWDWSP
jgi:Tol biopolymer transport system component/predicted Ser/Thr protein kinase